MAINNRQRLKQARSCYRETSYSIANRDLLCYWQLGTANNNLISELENHGWNILSTDNPSKVKTLVDRHSLAVGIIFIDTHAAGKPLDDIHAAISSANDFTWFALLDNRRRMSDAVCSLITNHCADFFTPPYDGRRILETLGHSDGMSRIKHRWATALREALPCQAIIGESPRIRKLMSQIQKVAKSDAPVLLTGETGTGKELTAQTIHNLSARSAGPFVAVNCAALPETLIQSELFGHEKGAFTGGLQRHLGRFESASGGTLFGRSA